VELEVLSPAVPVAALPTQPQGSGEDVAPAPAVELVVTAPPFDDTAGEALVPEGAAGAPVGSPAAVSFTNEARSDVPGAMMTWELLTGSGKVGPLAAAPDPTIAALAATVARAAATGSVACQATEAPAMMVWDSGVEAASATAWDVSASGTWNTEGSDDWDAAGSAPDGISCPRETMRGLVE
jgi:hypothetical protein